MIRKLRLMLLFPVLSICYSSYAQDPYVDANQLPNQSIQGSGDIGGNVVNVDLYTGITSVNIPIYNRTIEGIDVGVSLSYAANGIPVDQTASSVGLGWNLNAGGYIEREVKGMPDEFMYVADSLNPSSGTVTVGPGGIFAFPIPSYTDYNMLGALVNNTSVSGAVETEHDCFTAVFGGRSVKFAFDNLGNVYTCPHSALQVQMIVDGVHYFKNLPTNLDQIENTHLITFLITDEKGDCFYFNTGDFEITTTPPVDGLAGAAPSSPSNYYTPDKWVLTKIVTATGQVVQYNYNSYPLNYRQYYLETLQELASVYTPPASPTYTQLSVTDDTVMWNGYVSHISSIQYPDGTTVTFNLSGTTIRSDLAGVPYLASIKISNQYDATVKNSVTYQFNQAYFNSITGSHCSSLLTPEASISISYSSLASGIVASDHVSLSVAQNELNDGLRLKLKSITKIGNDGSTEPYYTFGYNSTMLPKRLSIAQDWYGYFNGATTINSYPAVPLHSGVGINKAPNITNLQACVLNTITNGKGGQIDLTYQAPPALSNATPPASDMDEDVNSFDGLCINTITYLDGYNNDNNYKTTYTFSNGYRFYPGAYYWYPTVYWLSSNEIWYRNMTNHMVTPMDFFNGSNHGYSQVQVTKNGYGGALLSTLVYNFSNIIYYTGGGGGSSPLIAESYLVDDQSSSLNHTFPRSSMDQPQMGLLLSTMDYGNNPSTSIPMNTVTNTYTTHVYSPLQNTATFTYPGSGIPPCSPAPPIPVTYTHAFRTYNVFNSEAVNLASKTEATHYGTGTMTKVTNYTYDSYDQLSTTSFVDSKGALWTNQVFHNYDYNFSGFTSTGPAETAGYMAINAMNTNNLQIVIAQEKRKNMSWATSGSADSVVSFSQWLPNYNSGLITINTNASSALNRPIPTSTFHTTLSGDFFKDNTFYNYDGNVTNISKITQYDDHNNAIESWNGLTQLFASAIYDTRIGRQIASVSNANYYDVFYTSFEGENGLNPMGTSDYNKGNWDFNPSNIVLAVGNAMTGVYYFNLTSAQTVRTIHPPTNAKAYYFSFWYKGATPTVYFGSTVISYTTQITIGSWKLATGTVTGNGVSTFYLQGPSSGCGIDELRLIPANAVISTSTYQPFLGINSKCDERNNIVYYEYDGMGRLKATRDINGNIISLSKNVVQGNDN